MNNRERIIRTLQGKPVDRAPYFMYMGIWSETEERWKKEGLAPGQSWDAEFGFDAGFRGVTEYWTPGNVNLGFCPWFEAEILEDRGETVIARDIFGIVKEDRKDGSCVARYIEHPVKTAEDWKKIKAERLNPEDPRRFPENWEALAEAYNQGDHFLIMGDYPYGLFGACRDLMGVEEFLVSFYTQPELIKDIMDSLTDFWIAIYRKICKKVKIDCVHMWEDMSGHQGSLISPAMVREYMLPNYKKIKAFCVEQEIPFFSVDTDGNVNELLPLFIEAGVNLMWPFEAAAGCDVLEYRKNFPEFGMMGGIDKRKIADGKEAIDAELEKVRVMLQYGRYIPALDHAAHPQISWEDFRYYASKLREIIEKSGSHGQEGDAGNE